MSKQKCVFWPERRCNSAPSQLVNPHSILKEIEDISNKNINIKEAIIVSAMKKEAEESKNATCDLEERYNIEAMMVK